MNNKIKYYKTVDIFLYSIPSIFFCFVVYIQDQSE